MPAHATRIVRGVMSWTPDVKEASWLWRSQTWSSRRKPALGREPTFCPECPQSFPPNRPQLRHLNYTKRSRTPTPPLHHFADFQTLFRCVDVDLAALSGKDQRLVGEYLAQHDQLENGTVGGVDQVGAIGGTR